MGKIAFVFAGQGAQYPGMGQELAQCSPAASQVFQQLDALRPGTSQQCFSGTEAELKETRNTQPCMFAVELAAAAALEEKGLRADLAAGFSLGEIGALAYTGAVDLETGFHLVCRRGELMQQAAEAQPTAMAAVLKLENAAVEALCAQFPETYPVNYNCPGQVSVACAKEQLAPFSAAVKAAGGRALPLKVAGGFHSPFMASAAQGFAQVLADCQVGQPKLPLYSNKTGAVYDGDPKELLAQQIVSPVRWETIVRNMIAAGADTFIELGPGKTLCAQCAKDHGVQAQAYQCDVADFAAAKAVVAQVKKDFGAVDVLVNNAGITQDGLLAMMKEESFDRVLDVDLKGAFNFIRHCTPLFLRQKGGAIVNITSVSGMIGNPGQANYAAAKAGLIGLTKAVAKELAPKGITCNAVAPGFIATDMTRDLAGQDNALLAAIPLGRMGQPQEVAQAVAFLATAPYITGEVLRVDGGIAM